MIGRAISCQAWAAHGALQGRSVRMKRPNMKLYDRQRKAERLTLHTMGHDSLGELPSYLKSE